MSKHQEIDLEQIVESVNLGETRQISTVLDLDEARMKAAKAAAQRQLQNDQDIPLDRPVPEAYRVRFVEFIREDLKDGEGNPILNPETGEADFRFAEKARIAVISSFVPIELFLEVTALRDQMTSLEVEDTNESREAIMEMYAECVLKVWNFTEPNMTVKRLRRGLDFNVIRGLFSRFFASLNANLDSVQE